MHIRYIDGNRLKRALIAGSHRLMDRAARLNAINVFPVPDGDTGTNMAGTARTMVLALQGASHPGVGATVRMAADSALRGARGNSGAILAQFLHGLAEELKDEARVTTRRFAAAARAAAHRTYQALSQPREGTILTVLKDWAEATHRLAERTDDFLVLLRGALEEARASLARTTELLPELKKSGLPDAGAEGVVHILEGIMAFIHRGRIRDLARSRGAGRAEAGDAADAASRETGADGLAEADLEGGAFEHGESAFRYCTECMALGEGMDLGALRKGLEALGDSVVVAGSPSLAKIHLHTDEPTKAFRLIESHGEIEGQKVDDMELQRRLSARPRAAAALLADSACDLPGGLGLELLVERVPVRVELGGKGYLDRDGLSADEFYAMLRANPRLATSTSQPAPAAFQRKFDLLLDNADEAVYVGLSAALSGTLEAGSRA
ncbi:MAG: DAK2 domain-containing protein, partial [Spirochaetaceae bacterium]|nr:DAK2 domain-containing protein [Spirochaetaceae bacterium]